ncbi:iron-containing redox enzyme family protein [Rhizobium leguminosarum]|uniref:iron-containing redox enzyme family protein n=1 Tax=Rhizobium leguminosarum TaxID=384 RepID=UPI001C923B7A|nr:iron-containing redox enzyme family protein [Rhizobium leguminosarum]MBY2998407.1 iron-containing redox enzyme family protein [Rhizobium leguminosarum]
MTTLNSRSVFLRSKIEVGLPLLFSAGDSIYAGTNVRERYCEHLIMLHGTMRASVPLMEAAMNAAERMQTGDPVAAQLAQYLRKHIPEEIGHDEWVLEDLEALGIQRQSVLARPPTALIAALVGSQYYWIQHYHPVALLGYIAVMEGYPPTVDRIDHFAETSGLPREALRTVRKHAHLDPHHRDDLDRELDFLPLTRDHEALIGLSAMNTISAVSDALSEVADRFRQH